MSTDKPAALGLSQAYRGDGDLLHFRRQTARARCVPSTISDSLMP